MDRKTDHQTHSEWEELQKQFGKYPVALWATDASRHITFAVGSWLDGAPHKRILGASVDEVFAAKTNSAVVVAHHVAALQGSEQSFRVPSEGRTLDIRISPVRDDAGAVVGCAAAAIDVTELARAEADVLRTEELLREAQRTSHVGSWDWDLTTNAVTWSEELFNIHGVEQGRFGGTLDAFLAQVHQEDRARVCEEFARGIEQRSISLEYRIVRANDREVRVIQTRGGTSRRDGLLMVGSSWDITAQCESETMLARTASLLDATLESTADGILVVDTDGKITRYNDRFFSMWKLRPEYLRRGDDAEAIAIVAEQLEDPPAFMRRIRELYTDTESESFDVLTFLDGRIFERFTMPQRLGDRVVGRVWSFRDVTERERLLARSTFLADASYLLGSLDVHNALAAVAELSVRSIADACAVDLFSAKEGGPRRLHLAAGPSASDIPTELSPTVLASNPVLENTAARSLVAVPLTSRGKLLGAISFLRGRRRRRYTTTDLELAEELGRRASLAMENARLYQRAQNALRARDEFLGIAAHEVRGPLAAVHLAAQTLDQARDLPEWSRKPISVILNQDRRLARLVDDLLDVTRIRSGHTHFELSKVNLGEVVREVSARCSTDLTRSGSPITIAVDGNIEGLWDRSAIEQIVDNLLSNAIKFGRGKPIEVHANPHDGRATLVVSDQGIGIPPERISSIFDPFERAVSVRHYGGLGLGLYVVKQLVTKMGGRVGISSQPNEGSTFTVELPQSRAS